MAGIFQHWPAAFGLAIEGIFQHWPAAFGLAIEGIFSTGQPSIKATDQVLKIVSNLAANEVTNF